MILMRTKERMRKRLKDAKGFTLVEMIVVLAIIAILIALIAPNVAKLIGNAQSTSDAAKTKTVMTSAQTYATEAVAAGYSMDIGEAETGTAFAGGEQLLVLGSGDADTQMRKFFNNGTVAFDKPFMTKSGDSYLPSNTFQGTDKAYVYYSKGGNVMGVVYCGGKGSDEIKGVSGVAPVGAVTGVDFGNNLVGGTISTKGVITAPK